jgi:hypothetical protein
MAGRAVRIRDSHRTWLTAHFFALVAGVGAAFVVNRFVTPDRLWAHFVAIGWGVAFALHLVVFARATLATMGGRSRGE